MKQNLTKKLDGLSLYIDHIQAEYNSLQQEYSIICKDIKNNLSRILFIQERCGNIISSLDKLKVISEENIKKYYLAEGPCILNFEI
jgi:hypothetical protein